jgi:hypothetical protein
MTVNPAEKLQPRYRCDAVLQRGKSYLKQASLVCRLTATFTIIVTIIE